MTDQLKVSPFQSKVLVVPELYDMFLGGGRGGAKSYSLALLAMRHIEQYGSRARVLYLRKTYKGLSDFESMTRDLFGNIYGRSARFNASEHVWKFASGGYFELGQLEGEGDYGKYQGRSFTLLLVDEAGQYSDPVLLDRLRSNLRGPKGMPVRMIMAANPADVGHHWLASRYVFKCDAPWKPFYEPKSKRHWVYAPSTFLSNPFIDQQAYKSQLESSCPTDPELLRAWLEGDWSVARGAYFAAVLEENRNVIEPWHSLPINNPRAFILPYKRMLDDSTGWEFYLAHDYGSAAPSVTYVCAKSPGAEVEGKYYPRDSIVLVDELATNMPGHLGKGMNWTIPVLADAIGELSTRWKIKPNGVADDACFARHGHGAGSIAEEFAAYGIRFYPAKKGDRRTGWEIMRRMLQDAGKPDVPGLYISRDCEYFWQTVPYLARDPKRIDDVDSTGPDHGADACRYGLLYQRMYIEEVPLTGL